MTQLGQNIRIRRLAMGMTQAELGEHAGLSPHHVSRLETQYVNVELETLLGIAAVLGCDVSELLADKLTHPQQQEPLNGHAHTLLHAFDALDSATKQAVVRIVLKLAREKR